MYLIDIKKLIKMNRLFLFFAIALLPLIGCKSNRVSTAKSRGYYYEPELRVLPKFNGDDSRVAFREWVSSQISFPEDFVLDSSFERVVIDGRVPIDRIFGRVIVDSISERIFVPVSFIIDVDGSVTDVNIPRSIHPLLDAEALRVVSLSPKWSPGLVRRRPVRVISSIIIPFILPVNQ